MLAPPNTPDWIALTPDPLPTDTASAFIAAPSAGGIAIFLGTTRAEINSNSQSLIALDYHAYDAMAAQQLHDLAARARQQWPIVKLALLHRTGRVALAEPSVLIAVSTPHRADAFAACQWLIDTLKKELAVWKKEIWSDGGENWLDSR